MLALFVSGVQVGGAFERIDTGADRYLCVNGDETLHVMFSSVPGATIRDWVPPPHVVTDSERAALLKQIDADTDAIYLAVQGYRGTEYLLAESDATAYKSAGYTGEVPSSVQSWASAKAQTAQWAADDILATAAGWRAAQSAIRAQRLARKEQARTATDLGPVAAAWAGFVATIRAALGVA